jgi:hypothetical protein
MAASTIRIRRTIAVWTRDPNYRPWGFWLLIMRIVAFGVTILGSLYLINYSTASINSPIYAAFYRIPGGLHTYGTTQLVLGIGLMIGLTRPTSWTTVRLRYVLGLIVVNGVYSWITALAFFAAPAVRGGERNVAWVLWLIIAMIYMVALPFTPTQHGLPKRINYEDYFTDEGLPVIGGRSDRP